MIVFALSYNLLLGETGLLSFGHAAYAGLGALIAAHVFNRVGVPLALLPLIGGIGAALCGALLGFIATRRAGTAFAMITLGIGELVSAAAWSLPDWFGGEAGVAIDRASGPMFGAWTFGPAREAYALIALWCLLASAAMFALSRTPFMRLANAVRDNPARAAAIGCYSRRIRHGVVVMSAFFAGVAGTLALINVELVSTESVSMVRSGSVLIATVIGGTGAFFGPVAGAVVLTFFSVAVASVTRAWLFYLGLLFIVIVVTSPDGLAGFVERHAARLAQCGWRAWLSMWPCGARPSCWRCSGPTPCNSARTKAPHCALPQGLRSCRSRWRHRGGSPSRSACWLAAARWRRLRQTARKSGWPRALQNTGDPR
ncbi:MAG: ABC transporter, permease protein 2 RSc1752 [uncultured Paraburkholderia sp.]|nr:MAG: ABC transporter, permease protein 2 RSc1752 [uncultured Paraburkholderia sp.]CAH2907594.1 MAG: ABC transporter, permease protein 2 RSc1752 [uncultured Paraburkholderia sp.]